MRRVGTLEQLCDYVNELREVIAALIEVTNNLNDRIERLEDDNHHLRQGMLPD